NIELYKRAATYIDRILKGEKPADLPVQLADKYKLVVNLKAARMLGLEIPVSVLARTDQVIEQDSRLGRACETQQHRAFGVGCWVPLRPRPNLRLEIPVSVLARTDEVIE